MYSGSFNRFSTLLWLFPVPSKKIAAVIFTPVFFSLAFSFSDFPTTALPMPGCWLAIMA